MASWSCYLVSNITAENLASLELTNSVALKPVGRDAKKEKFSIKSRSGMTTKTQ